MNVYAINICTDTKNTDRYDKVAVNKYPIIVIGTHEELVKYLKSDEMRDFVKNLFRTQNLYDAAVFKVRSVNTRDYEVNSDDMIVKDFVGLEYKSEYNNIQNEKGS